MYIYIYIYARGEWGNEETADEEESGGGKPRGEMIADRSFRFCGYHTSFNTLRTLKADLSADKFSSRHSVMYLGKMSADDRIVAPNRSIETRCRGVNGWPWNWRAAKAAAAAAAAACSEARLGGLRAVQAKLHLVSRFPVLRRWFEKWRTFGTVSRELVFLKKDFREWKIKLDRGSCKFDSA